MKIELRKARTILVLYSTVVNMHEERSPRRTKKNKKEKKREKSAADFLYTLPSFKSFVCSRSLLQHGVKSLERERVCNESRSQ